MNTATTPAKVAPIKASHLLMQDENSGRDGRRYNEWLASRLDARLRARESAQRIADDIADQYDDGDNRSASRNVPMLLAAFVVSLPIAMALVWHVVGYFVKASAQ